MEPNWILQWEKSAVKQFDKLPQTIQKKIQQHLEVVKTSPFSHGKALTGSKLTGCWRYRVEDYRIICKLNPRSKTISVTEVGHRKKIYH